MFIGYIYIYGMYLRMCLHVCLCSGKQKVIVNITVDFVSHILCLSGCNFRLFSTFPSLLIFLFLDFLLYGYNIFSILWVGLRQTGGRLWITVFDPELFNFSVVQKNTIVFHIQSPLKIRFWYSASMLENYLVRAFLNHKS